ncbi:type II toxin-antitoxin system RelE/ParE family toxin [Brumimicrobium aurantiacum]|uniref:Type II toxin-antitoxin system RelE/ParE family toxin n=1 Tax=Brumimicrobium aurantiacum TaxID=1737063 RepID=A0A3E1F0H8_9FLAO|nr:type II toxin-antitoxin system RelE/ParE family toxin [Brumimicrobium aurantiacum]RFC55329.1 type II toxin-antitoxin system RelE/ParE family toxin [Brumimicrobium aurantiacum]
MKSFSIRVLKSAVADLDEAYEYYTDINPKLGERFIKIVNATINDLKKYPYYQIRYDSFRMKVINKFPYVIHYTLDEKKQIVFIYGIRNSYQNPKKYPKV